MIDLTEVNKTDEPTNLLKLIEEWKRNYDVRALKVANSFDGKKWLFNFGR